MWVGKEHSRAAGVAERLGYTHLDSGAMDRGGCFEGVRAERAAGLASEACGVGRRCCVIDSCAAQRKSSCDLWTGRHHRLDSHAGSSHAASVVDKR